MVKQILRSAPLAGVLGMGKCGKYIVGSESKAYNNNRSWENDEMMKGMIFSR